MPWRERDLGAASLLRGRVIAYLNYSKAVSHPSQQGCCCPLVGRSRSHLPCSAHVRLLLEQLLKCPRERRGGRAVAYVHNVIFFSLAILYLGLWTL